MLVWEIRLIIRENTAKYISGDLRALAPHQERLSLEKVTEESREDELISPHCEAYIHSGERRVQLF